MQRPDQGSTVGEADVRRRAPRRRCWRRVRASTDRSGSATRRRRSGGPRARPMRPRSRPVGGIDGRGRVAAGGEDQMTEARAMGIRVSHPDVVARLAVRSEAVACGYRIRRAAAISVCGSEPSSGHGLGPGRSTGPVLGLRCTARSRLIDPVSGLLVSPGGSTQRRPIGVVAPGVDREGCDHADGAPAACYSSRETQTPRLYPWSARHDIVRSAPRCRMVNEAQSCTSLRTGCPSGSEFLAPTLVGAGLVADDAHWRHALRCRSSVARTRLMAARYSQRSASMGLRFAARRAG